MSGPALAPDDIFAKARELRAAGVPLEEIDRYLSHHLDPGGTGDSSTPRAAPIALPITPGHSKFTAQQLEGRAIRQVENAQDEQNSTEPSYAQQALGGVASFARDIPGAEAAQAGLRSLVNNQPYRDAFSDIRTAEDANGATGMNRVAGGALAALAIPGAPVLQGARYGVLTGLLQANPDASVENRLHDAIKQGAIDAALVYGGRKLARVDRVLEQAPASAAPTELPAITDIIEQRAPAELTREEAGAQLQQLLQKSLDEGMAARDAVPPTNWALMDKMERALQGPGGKRIIPGIRNTTGDLRYLNSLLPPPP